MPLSDKQCHAAKPKIKPYKLADFEGLYLEIWPSGAKYWRLKYRLHGKEKRISLGIYPTVSLHEARQKKLAVKNEIKTGVNPVLSRLEHKQIQAFVSAQTFEEVAREWHTKQIEIWEPKHGQTVLHRLEKYLFPHLGNYPAKAIKSITILSCLQKIEKTAPEMARRLKQYCHHIFTYAIVTGRVDNDPTYGLGHALKKYKKKHFASLDIDRLPTFLKDLTSYSSHLRRQTYLAIKIMMLTFLRTAELIGGKWDEIDFEKSLWIIPAQRMKMKRPHVVPLSKQAVDILLELKEMNINGDYIFPSVKAKRRQTMSKGTILVALKRMGYNGQMTGHGFRALAMGILKEKLGYQHDVVDRQLAHAPKSGNDRAYDRSTFLPQRIEMMQRFADYIDSIDSTQ